VAGRAGDVDRVHLDDSLPAMPTRRGTHPTRLVLVALAALVFAAVLDHLADHVVQ
jgi:hypothetical protein